MNPSTSHVPSNPRWPQADIDEANERYRDAKHRELAAEPGESKDQAIADGWEALGDRQAVRTEAANGIIGLMRIANEEMPLQLSTVIEQLPIIKELIEAVADLEANRKRGAR